MQIKGERIYKMGQFESWQSYNNFEQFVTRKNRFIRDTEAKKFLETILETGKNRRRRIKKNAILWRSQLGHDLEPLYQESEYVDDIPCPFSPERMKPLKYTASEGRANPKGIPYLYLSNDKDTALAEIRPWIGSLISLAQFKTNRDLFVVDCFSQHKGDILYFEEPDASKREEAVWAEIDKAFAKPITISDKTAEYVPTQIIAELFKNNGFDGIAYRSSLGKGLNITLFDLDSADIVNCSLQAAKGILFEFEKTANTYFVKKQSDNNNES